MGLCVISGKAASWYDARSRQWSRRPNVFVSSRGSPRSRTAWYSRRGASIPKRRYGERRETDPVTSARERRASYEGAGGFDAAALASDLSRGRLKVASSSLIFPGAPIIVQAGLFVKLDGWSQTLDYLADAQQKLFGAALF